MSSSFEFQISKLKIKSSKFFARRRTFVFLSLLFSFFCFSACSIPNLEQTECTDARQTVRDFYSYHFGNDMRMTPENLKLRGKFLTAELNAKLQSSPTVTDPFTLTDDTPKAFRVGDCRVVEPNENTDLGVLLFWKTDTRTEQREIRVEVRHENDKWLVNRIYDK